MTCKTRRRIADVEVSAGMERVGLDLLVHWWDAEGAAAYRRKVVRDVYITMELVRRAEEAAARDARLAARP